MRACTRIARDRLSPQCSSNYRREPSWYVFHKEPIRATMTRCVRRSHCLWKSGRELHAEQSGSFVSRSVRTDMEQSTAVGQMVAAEAAGSFNRISLGKIGQTFKIRNGRSERVKAMFSSRPDTQARCIEQSGCLLVTLGFQ